MRCGEVAWSTRPQKKIMKKYCEHGKEKLVHAGVPSTRQNPNAKTRSAFRKRHGCATAKTATPRHLACSVLWPESSSEQSRKFQTSIKK